MGGHDNHLPGRLKSKICQSVEVKNEERGEVRAVIATLNVKDKEGDLILPGAFGTQDVLVSAYNHATWGGALPVGRGRVYEQGNEAIADLKFFMDDEAGRRHFRLIKNVGSAQEFSFGFDVTDKAEPNDAQRQMGIVRVIKRFKVYEVSPVFLGAGVNTRVLAAKTEQQMQAEMVGLAKDSIDLLLEGEATVERMERRAVKRKAREAAARVPPAALRAAGHLGRIHWRGKSFPPFDGIPNGHVVVTPDGRAWQFLPNNTGPAWQEVMA